MIWSVPREWVGDTVFVIAGGPSVTQKDVDLLRGRKVVVINSSYVRATWADFLFFADSRWFGDHKRSLLGPGGFNGRIVGATQSVRNPAVLMLNKVTPPPSLTMKPTDVAMNRTSVSGAINMCVLLGATVIALLGVDLREAGDGRTHHHDPHRWPIKKGCWDDHAKELRNMVEPLRRVGVRVINCSPVSLANWWPKKTIEEVLAWT